jgi:uncharacterized OB-fold protein
MSSNCQWIEASGRGRIFTWQVTHSPFYPAWDTPYVVAIVELDEGPRMHTNIVDCNREDLHIDMPVELVFQKIEDQDWYLPRFKPATSS